MSKCDMRSALFHCELSVEFYFALELPFHSLAYNLQMDLQFLNAISVHTHTTTVVAGLLHHMAETQRCVQSGWKDCECGSC